MPRIAFDELPDHARLWVFPADRTLSAEERARVEGVVAGSLAEWAAHGSPVRWGFTLVHDRFLLVGVDESHTALTGCSIDRCVDAVRDLEREWGVSFLDNGRVFFRRDGTIDRASRPGFRELVVAGAVTLDTPVFDPVIATVGDYRGGAFERPAREAWHARAFPFAS